MAPNKVFMYNSIPNGWPESGKDLTVECLDFDLSAPAPQNGITTHNVYTTFDPSQRGRMRDPAIKSYSPAMEAGHPVTAIAVIGRVLKSDNSDYEEGDTVRLWNAYTETYSAISKDKIKDAEKLDPAPGIPLTAYLGVLGMTGMTAYGSLHEIGRPKKGETILVSGAAGSVGQVVGQIALREGLRVIGSVGDDTKLDFIIKELGFHGGFNYKKETAMAALERLAPDGIDIYYDNVGGETLDAALFHMNPFGRIVACGAISTYNNKPGEGYGVKNYNSVVRKRLRWQGFIVFDENIAQHRKARDENVSKWLAEGSFKSVDHVTEGMDNAIDGFLGMLRGDNLGKSVLRISDE